MKIARVEVFPLEFPFRSAFLIAGGVAGRPGEPSVRVLVRLKTEGGAVGWGEATPTPRWTYETTETIVSTLRKYLAPAVKGIEIWNFDALHRAMDRAISPGVTPGSPLAKSAIDVAAHDALGKALGGASGGYVAGPAPVIQMLRQRSRPYLFSNTLAPMIAGASLTALDLIEAGEDLRARLNGNAERFRAEMGAAGFTLAGAGHPIIPVMLGEAHLAGEFAAAMMRRGVYVTAFSFPVVPRGQARIRTQMSAAHGKADLDRAIAAFIATGRDLKVIR